MKAERLVRPALLGLAGLALSLVALQRDAPLFVNFGAGDEPFAQGFRSGWERDKREAAGHTMFHWAKDGSRLELPLRVVSGAPEARVRLARFISTPAEIRVWAHGQIIHRWDQPGRDWSVRTLPLRELRGPFSLQIRAQPTEGEMLAVAFDWMEIQGVARVWPRATLLLQLVVLFLGVPILAAWLHGRTAALILCSLLAVAGPLAILADRFGGIVALGQSAVPMAIIVCALAIAAGVLRRLGGDVRAARPVALSACLLASAALFQPFFFYPDVDTHARFVDAIARDPKVAWDPTPYQQRHGAWTRTIGGKTIGFPYSPVFHVAAIPLRAVIGSVGAVKTLAITSVGASILAVAALGGLLGLAPMGHAVAGLLLAVMPVVSSRLTLALYPALLAQGLELILGVFLVRWCVRDNSSFAALALALLGAQIAYTGSIVNVGSVVFVVGVVLGLNGAWGKTARLWSAEAAAVLVVVTLLYARFVPTLVRDVLPAATGLALDGSAPGRLFIFYGVVYPALTILGLVALRASEAWARLVVVSMLVAGTALLFLRYALPGLLRDVKDVELLAGPVAVLSAVALSRLWNQGLVARGVAGIAVLLLLLRGAAQAVTAYTERFVAVGLS